MKDIDMLERAMLRAHKRQLGFAFLGRYLELRQQGQTPHSSIRTFEQEWQLKPDELTADLVYSRAHQIGSAVLSCLGL